MIGKKNIYLSSNNKKASFFWPHCKASGILFWEPGIKPTIPALEMVSLNHWTIKEFSSQIVSSHSPVIPNQFISIQPWNSSCYPVSISHLSFNSKFKNPVIPFTNKFFWFGSCIKVPWIRLLIFFFFYKECSKFEPFYLYISLPRHAHRHGQGGDVKSTLRLWPAPSLRLTLTVLIFRHHPFSCCPQQRHPTVSFTFILDSLQDTVCRVLGDLKAFSSH